MPRYYQDARRELFESSGDPGGVGGGSHSLSGGRQRGRVARPRPRRPYRRLRDGDGLRRAGLGALRGQTRSHRTRSAVRRGVGAPRRVHPEHHRAGRQPRRTRDRPARGIRPRSAGTGDPQNPRDSPDRGRRRPRGPRVVRFQALSFTFLLMPDYRQLVRYSICSSVSCSGSTPRVASLVRATYSSISSGMVCRPGVISEAWLARWWAASAWTAKVRSMISTGCPSAAAMLTSLPLASTWKRRPSSISYSVTLRLTSRTATASSASAARSNSWS